jgi:hypothetical protein
LVGTFPIETAIERHLADEKVIESLRAAFVTDVKRILNASFCVVEVRLVSITMGNSPNDVPKISQKLLGADFKTLQRLSKTVQSKKVLDDRIGSIVAFTFSPRINRRATKRGRKLR